MKFYIFFVFIIGLATSQIPSHAGECEEWLLEHCKEECGDDSDDVCTTYGYFGQQRCTCEPTGWTGTVHAPPPQYSPTGCDPPYEPKDAACRQACGTETAYCRESPLHYGAPFSTDRNCAC